MKTAVLKEPHPNLLAWPFPVVRYLRREIKSEEVLAQAVNNDQRTEAYAYVGLDLLLSGFLHEAMDHFHWVAQYGNQSYFEYDLARVEIGRVERGTRLSTP